MRPRWQLELYRLLVDPVFLGHGVARGDGRPVVLMPGFGGGDQTLRVLASTRSACAWAALGHAVAAYDPALTHTKRRQQFGRPLCSFQIIQERLVNMLADVTAMQLYCLEIGRLAERGQLSDTIAGLAKLNNTRTARKAARRRATCSAATGSCSPTT